MTISNSTPDRNTADLMARVLDDAWLTASLKTIGLSEDDWSEMADGISHAVAGGLRDTERLQRIALDALDARREILCRDVLASSMSFDSGESLAGCTPRRRE